MPSSSTPAPTRIIRRAEPAEAGALAALQNRSSTHWGYPDDFFDWAPGAHDIPEAYICDSPVYLLEEHGRVTGFYGFTMEDGDLLLDKLFVDLDRIGTGRGKLLWRHAVNLARDQGRESFVIGSDPNAAPFYEAMGAVWFAAKPTAEPRWTVQMFRYAIPPLTLRPALPEDAPVLHALTQRSVMHWGYEPAFLDWNPEAIAVTPESIRNTVTWVLVEGERVVGYAMLDRRPPDLYLDKLFVEPGWIGTGFGKRLWRHAVETARGMGYGEMLLDADPNAAPFYRAMGAEWVREIETTWPGWRLQLFRVDLNGNPSQPKHTPGHDSSDAPQAKLN